MRKYEKIVSRTNYYVFYVYRLQSELHMAMANAEVAATQGFWYTQLHAIAGAGHITAGTSNFDNLINTKGILKIA